MKSLFIGQNVCVLIYICCQINDFEQYLIVLSTKWVCELKEGQRCRGLYC